MSNVVLQKEFEYFINNLPELVKKYKGKYLVIKNEQILNSYDSIDMAIIETKKTEALGTFLVQKCDDNEESYTRRYCSRVSFTQ